MIMSGLYRDRVGAMSGSCRDRIGVVSGSRRNIVWIQPMYVACRFVVFWLAVPCVRDASVEFEM